MNHTHTFSNVSKIVSAIVLLLFATACGAANPFERGESLESAESEIAESAAPGTLPSLNEASFDANVKPLFATSCDRCHSAPTYAESVTLSVLGDPANSPLYQKAVGMGHRTIFKDTSAEAKILADWIMGK